MEEPNRHSGSQLRKLVLTDRDQEDVTDWWSLVDRHIFLSFFPSQLQSYSYPTCRTKGNVCARDAKSSLMVNLGSRYVPLALGKLVNDDTHGAWEPATARIVELAAVPQLLVGSF
jgi:hypothetical protein